jgi:hypothetical protein
LFSAFWGILSIAALYWVGTLLFNRAVGISAAVFLAIAPWHVHFSRLAIEVNLAAFFVLLALGLFYRWYRKPESHWLWGAALISGLGLYTYSSVKMSLPIIIGAMAIIFWKKLRTHQRHLIPAFSLGFLIAAPMLYKTLVSAEVMQDHFRQISIFDPGRPVGEIVVEVTWNFLANLSPRYLFHVGSLDIVMHPPGMGQLFAIQGILLAAGIFYIFKNREWTQPGGITLIWIVASIFPATLTRNLFGTGHAQRTYPVVIAWQLLSAVGFIGIYQWLRRRFLKMAIVLTVCICVLRQGLSYYGYYFTQYAADSSSQFYAGVDKLVNAVNAVEENYQAVYYTTFGNDLPYIHFLFYSQYDPLQLLENPLVTDPALPDRVIRMGKYTFTEQVEELYLSGLPGLYILPKSALPDVAGLDIVPGIEGQPHYKLVGRERILIDTSDWLGQCNRPIAPLTYDKVSSPNDSIWLAEFNCNTAWIYPKAGTPIWGYIFHQDMETQMNDFARRHMDGAQKVLSLPHQIRDVGAFTAYEQQYQPQAPLDVSGILHSAESVPDIVHTDMLDTVLFDEKIVFEGMRIYSSTEQIEINTWWQVDVEGITRPFSIMAHLLDESGNIVANADGLGFSPIVLRKGDYFVQRHIFHGHALTQKAWLRLGIYWIDTMERWTVSENQDVDAVFIVLMDKG